MTPKGQARVRIDGIVLKSINEINGGSFMARTITKGNCYLCGKYLAKSGVVKHLAAAHDAEGADVQRCVLLKVEAGDYWL